MMKFINKLLGRSPKERPIDWGDTDTRLADAMEAVNAETGFKPEHFVGMGNPHTHMTADEKMAETLTINYDDKGNRLSHLERHRKSIEQLALTASKQLDAQRAKVLDEIKLLLEMQVTTDAYRNAFVTIEDGKPDDTQVAEVFAGMVEQVNGTAGN